MRRPLRRHLIVIVILVTMIVAAHYFGLLSSIEAPPLLAPGVR